MESTARNGCATYRHSRVLKFRSLFPAPLLDLSVLGRGAEAISSRASGSDQLRSARRKGQSGCRKLRRNRSGSCCRGGWGTGLRPVHCHPFRWPYLRWPELNPDGALSRGSSPEQFPRGSFLSFRSLQKISDRMNLFELTRALVDIESITNHEKNVARLSVCPTFFLARALQRPLERMAGRAESRQHFRLLGRADRHAFDAPGHGAAVLSLARRC